MPIFDVKCPSCGWEASDRWESGAPTPCGQCGAATAHAWHPHLSKARAMVDEWPSGGAWMENGFPKPRFFETRSSYHKALKANGFCVRGDGEEQFSWFSAEALEKAKALVERVTSTPASAPTVEASEPVSVSRGEMLHAIHGGER